MRKSLTLQKCVISYLKFFGIKEKKVIALLNALKDEGKFKDLSEKLLDEVY